MQATWPSKGMTSATRSSRAMSKPCSEGACRSCWKRMEALPTARDVPVSAIEAMEHLFPAPNLEYRVARRVAGLGSLGHARYVALAKWQGHWIAREAKALVPSASYWAKDNHGLGEILYQTILNKAVRCPDPFVHLYGQWIVRR